MELLSLFVVISFLVFLEFMSYKSPGLLTAKTLKSFLKVSAWKSVCGCDERCCEGAPMTEGGLEARSGVYFSIGASLFASAQKELEPDLLSVWFSSLNSLSPLCRLKGVRFQAERLGGLSEDNNDIKEREKKERAGDVDRKWDGREGGIKKRGGL